MREILFKAKRYDTGEWIEGSLITLDADSGYYFISEPYTGASTLPVRNLIFDHTHLVKAETICQYTGLTDKNGKKIWENDIVDASKAWWDAAGPAGHDSPIIPVEWDDGYCGFTPFADYDCDCGVFIESNDVEVVGNVFDNADLLKE